MSEALKSKKIKGMGSGNRVIAEKLVDYHGVDALRRAGSKVLKQAVKDVLIERKLLGGTDLGVR